jgi:hypothetical protein
VVVLVGSSVVVLVGSSVVVLVGSSVVVLVSHLGSIVVVVVVGTGGKVTPGWQATTVNTMSEATSVASPRIRPCHPPHATAGKVTRPSARLPRG